MLLLVTVISIETCAAYDFGEVTINGIESMLLKGQTTTIKYSLTYYNKNDCPDGPKTLEEGDYDVEVVYEEGNDEKVFCVENIYGNLTITLTQIYKPKTCKLVFSPKYGGYYEGDSKMIYLSVVRFEGSSPFVVVNRDEGLTLKLLAECVNAGISFKGESFKLGTDLNYEGIAYIPIGGKYDNEDRFFEGTFDGDGHTIKGVNISSSTGDVGLFGGISKGAVIKNLTLDNASITGLNVTGGIVGCNTGGIITNCHVTSSVTIKAKEDSSGERERFGGIVGNNGYYEKVGTEKKDGTEDNVCGKVSNCSSAATLQGANRLVGGIAGNNEPGCTLSNNVVVGANISAKSNYGAIAGCNNGGNLGHNYYADCTGTNIGGCDGADVNEEDGAERAIALYDTKDNATTISQNINVILAGRTLYKDGKWNTLCLPFSMTDEQIAASDLAGATIMRLDCSESSSYTHVTGFESETGTLHLNFTTATNISAGTPYIIKWANGNNLVDPVFSSVNVTNAGLVDNIVSNDGYLKFKGTYSPKNIYTADKTFLYLGSDNKLYYPSGVNMTSFNVNACRAYFELLKGLTAGDPISGVRSFSLNFDGDPTGITTTNYTNFTNSEDTWYDLQGRRIANGKLSNGKLPKGLYIHNGRKVVIK